jgi:hypothetical protein
VRAAGWSRELGLEGGRTVVLADPGQELYAALGAGRPLPLWALRPRVAAAGVRALLARERVGWTRGDDGRLLGADVVVDADGRVVLLHVATDATDRVAPAQLVAALEGAAAAPPLPSLPPVGDSAGT